jgi:hypothetical protein
MRGIALIGSEGGSEAIQGPEGGLEKDRHVEEA